VCECVCVCVSHVLTKEPGISAQESYIFTCVCVCVCVYVCVSFIDKRVLYLHTQTRTRLRRSVSSYGHHDGVCVGGWVGGWVYVCVPHVSAKKVNVSAEEPYISAKKGTCPRQRDPCREMTFSKKNLQLNSLLKVTIE